MSVGCSPLFFSNEIWTYLKRPATTKMLDKNKNSIAHEIIC